MALILHQEEIMRLHQVKDSLCFAELQNLMK
jgi:hypothetical protein